MDISMTTDAPLVVGVSSLLVLFFVWRMFMLPTSPRLPPGPRPLPIVGNWLMVRKYGSLHNLANELKRKYGPIVTVWMWSRPVIIISEPDIIQEAFITQGSIFMGRIQLPSTSVLHRDYRGLAFGHGERHRFFRKLLVSNVLSSKRVGGFRPIREKELDSLVESLKQELGDEKNGGVVTNFRSIIRMTVSNLVVGLLFGRRFTLKEYVDLQEVMAQRLLLITGKLRDFVPRLAWLPDTKGVKVQLALVEKASRILQPLIEERKKALLLSGKKGNQQATFVDILLRVQSGETNVENSIEISDGDVEHLCIEILNAGTETTAINVECCIANLIDHPEMQEKLVQEISAVVGERVVNEDDIPQLPYLQAVVKEGLRRHSPVRLGVPRRSLSDTKIAGYDIPMNTTVMQHLEAVALSPKIWEDPLEFRPERHLNKTLDITGSTEITMIPFGVGRRICPAINMGFLHGELILARLIQAFEWKSTTPGQLLDLSPGKGMTASLKYPLVTCLQERLTVSQNSASSV